MRQQRVDVLFLDIQMPRETGIDFSRELSRLDTPPVVIFVTAYERYALSAFKVHALDYLLKPFDDERLARSLARAEAMLALRSPGPNPQITEEDRLQVPSYQDRISVRSVGQVEVVKLEHVLWLSASGNYVELHLDGRTVLHRATLSSLESQLDPAVFMRVHRSILVRLNHLAKLAVTGDGTYSLTLDNGDVVPVSERYVQRVRDLLHA